MIGEQNNGSVSDSEDDNQRFQLSCLGGWYYQHGN
jgi:hypothetical protein